MSLEFFYAEDFLTVSDLDPVDTFVGDGVNDTFSLVQLTGSELAATITVENVQYYQFTGGMVKSGDTFTLSSVPALNSQIVAPGIIALVFAGFDQETVAGVTNPRVVEIPFYLGDPTQIHLYNYTNLPQYTGIRISFVDLTSGFGAETSWCQLACSSPTDGTAMTYGATGDYLLTGAIQGYSSLSASGTAGASSLTVSSATDFTVGDYLIINPGDITQEIRKLKEKTSTTLGFFTNLEYNHAVAEDVHDMGRKFWAKVTIPLNAANNQAFNFHNLGLRRQARNNSKV